MSTDRNDRFQEVSAPGTPTTGTAVVYVKTDGKLYCKDDQGVERAAYVTPAAYVNPATATAGQVATALIAAGLMAAS